MEKTNGSFELTKDGITLYVNSESVQTISDFITCTAKEITVSNTRCCSIINNYLHDILKK